MRVYVIENRSNDTVRLCLKSAHAAGIDLKVIAEVEAGDSYEAFAKNYVHLSTNSPAFELICFKRYFLLSKAAGALDGGARIVLTDSDVLFYPGFLGHVERNLCGVNGFCGSYIKEEALKFKQISPHVSIWTKDGLEDFLAFLCSFYENKINIIELTEIARLFAQKRIGGGVSDMTLLWIWATSRGYLNSVSETFDSGVVDHNITSSSNFRKNEFYSIFGFKRIYFFENNPHFRRLDDGNFVPVHLLHFQGRAKTLMKYVLRRNIIVYSLIACLIAIARITRSKVRHFKNDLSRV